MCYHNRCYHSICYNRYLCFEKRFIHIYELISNSIMTGNSQRYPKIVEPWVAQVDPRVTSFSSVSEIFVWSVRDQTHRPRLSLDVMQILQTVHKLLDFTVLICWINCRYIGMSVYNVFVLCTIGAPLSLAVREKPDASFSIVSTCIIVCTSITLCLVFIPKVSVMFC